MLLRELVTRFGFDVDTKNIKKYDGVMSSMSGKAKKLGLLFGGAFSAKQMFGLGLTVKQTSEDLRRLAGTDFSKFNSAIEKTKSILEGNRKGSSDILTANTANALGSFFIKNVGKSQQDIKDFTKMLTLASVAAFNTKKSIEEVFSGLVDSRNNGGAGVLLGLGGFDKKRQGRVEHKMDLFAGEKVLGGEFNRNIRGNILRKETDDLLPIMLLNLRNLDDELFSVKRAKNTASDSIQKVSSEATDRGVSFLKALTEIPDKGIKGALFDLPEQKPIFKGGGKIRRDTNEPFYKNGSNNFTPTQNTSSNKIENNITNNNTFNITTDDPRKAAAIAVQKMNDEVRKARNQRVPSENR